MTSAALLPRNVSNWVQKQATPRAIAGLGLLIAVLAGVGLTELSATTAQLETDVEELRREHQLLTALVADDGWTERAALAQASVGAVEERFWRGDTTGIVAARLQGAVEAAAREAEISRPRVSVQPRPDPFGPRAVTFEISLSARDPEGQFLSLFQALVRAEGFLLPTGFEWSNRNAQLEIRLLAPAILSANSTDPAQGAAP